MSERGERIIDTEPPADDRAERQRSMVISRPKVAVIGSGNIGTDLMIKVLRLSDTLEMGAMVGIDPASDGLARADRLGVPTTADGVCGLIAMPHFDEIDIVFDATSAGAHQANAAALAPYGKRLIDLTPAAIGPFVVPAVNLDQHLDAADVNMVTCGGQATIPIVAAISRITDVPYAEIVASIASKSAGPGTRANIDEFTETTSHAIEAVGGAARGRAIIILNPAEPPLIMRDTVLALIGDPNPQTHAAVRESIEKMVAEVAAYVPGYRLKQDIQIIPVAADTLDTLVGDTVVTHQISVFLEVEGAAHYLPSYAGNLDIMTSAALRVAERLAAVPTPESVQCPKSSCRM
jgi:acetaldehyde dehydrogenase